MNLKESVSNQVAFSGGTPGGCKLLLKNLLDHGRDVFQFMQLFNEKAIQTFYYEHFGDIDLLVAEDEGDEGFVAAHADMVAGVKLALEKTLIIVEGEIKNGSNGN